MLPAIAIFLSTIFLCIYMIPLHCSIAYRLVLRSGAVNTFYTMVIYDWICSSKSSYFTIIIKYLYTEMISIACHVLTLFLNIETWNKHNVVPLYVCYFLIGYQIYILLIISVEGAIALFQKILLSTNVTISSCPSMITRTYLPTNQYIYLYKVPKKWNIILSLS